MTLQLNQAQMADFNFLCMTVMEYASPVWELTKSSVREAHLHIFFHSPDDVGLTVRVIYDNTTHSTMGYDEISIFVQPNVASEHIRVSVSSIVSDDIIAAEEDRPKKYSYDYSEIRRAAKHLVDHPKGGGDSIHVSAGVMSDDITTAVCQFVFRPEAINTQPANQVWLLKDIGIEYTKPEVLDGPPVKG